MTDKTLLSKYFVSNWIDLVKEDTLWQEKYEMSKEEMDVFIDLCLSDKASAKDVRKKLTDFYGWIATEVMLHERIFIRWDNRSPKDWWHYHSTNYVEAMGKPSPITSTDKAVEVLLRSERLFEDIYADLFNGVFWIAPYREITDEVRVFVYKGHVIGISQYYKTWERRLDLNPGWMLSRYFEIYSKYKKKLDEVFGSYVIDFGWNAEDCKPTLIEINPYTDKTCPRLLDWSDLKKIEKRVDHGKEYKVAMAIMSLQKEKSYVDKKEIDELFVKL